MICQLGQLTVGDLRNELCHREVLLKVTCRDALGPVSFGLRTSNNHGIPLGSRCHFIHFHPSSHLLPKSTTTVGCGHYYSILKQLVRLTGPMSPRWRAELGLTPRLSVFKVMCSNYQLCIIWPHRKTQERVMNVQHNLRISGFPGELFDYVVSLFLS